MVGRVELAITLRRARKVLRQREEPCPVSMETFVRWLHTETPYPNPSFNEIVRSPYFVVHELVEIREVRRMGLRITKDVILQHPVEIDRAHYIASCTEFEIAAEDGAVSHLEARLPDVLAWSEDPTVVPRMKKRYRTLHRTTSRILLRLKAGRRTGKRT